MNKIPHVLYKIDIPSVSSGFRKTYKKNLEVFELQIERNNDLSSYYKLTATHKYYRSTDTWVRKTQISSLEYVNENQIRVEPLFNEKELNNREHLYFLNLKHACATKVFLINRMKTQYEQAISDLLDTMKRNVPNVDDLVKQYKIEYAEYFI